MAAILGQSLLTYELCANNRIPNAIIITKIQLSNQKKLIVYDRRQSNDYRIHLIPRWCVSDSFHQLLPSFSTISITVSQTKFTWMRCHLSNKMNFTINIKVKKLLEKNKLKLYAHFRKILIWSFDKKITGQVAETCSRQQSKKIIMFTIIIYIHLLHYVVQYFNIRHFFKIIRLDHFIKASIFSICVEYYIMGCN